MLISRAFDTAKYPNNTQPIYIVGAGSFAFKLALVLDKHDLTFEFIDEYVEKKLLGCRVTKAAELSSACGTFFVAISIEKYAIEAQKRLAQQGISNNQCLHFICDSSTLMLDQMLTLNKALTKKLYQRPMSDFISFENAFFSQRKTQMDSLRNEKKRLIAFTRLGRGGGYPKHLANLAEKLSATCNVMMLSDTPPSTPSASDNFQLMSQLAMSSCEVMDLVITAIVYPCSPSHIRKLSLVHMVYDFLLFSEQTYEHLQQADTHYIFVPSKASMKLHQKICFERSLTNNIILIPGGYPRHDENIIQFQKYPRIAPEQGAIIYAPTLSSLPAGNETDSCYSIIEAIEFVPRILSEFPERDFIFRPHPEDLALVNIDSKHPRAIAFQQLISWCENHPRCTIDNNKMDYLLSFSKSEILITDTSSVAFSFGLITNKAVIFFSHDHDALATDFADCDFISERKYFGVCVSNSDSLIQQLKTSLANSEYNLRNHEFCQQVIYNVGSSEQYLVNNLPYILEDIKHPDWWYLQDHIGPKNVK